MEKVPSINNTTPYFQFPPGFRFHPSDEELIVHYLRNKVTSRPLPASIAAEIDLYKYNPWELPKKALFREGEWYFFSPRDRKYPKGERPNRAAGLGYWKAAGIDQPIFSSVRPKQIGVKKSLVFYAGRPPKGTKTDWYMNEYRLHSSIKPPKLKGSMRLDDWVLCRVRCKGNMPKNTGDIQDSHNTELLMRLPIPNVEKTNFASANRDMISDYISKDCILLAWILSGQPVHLADTNIPKVNFEGSQNGNSLNGYNRGNSPIVSPMDNNFSNFSLLNGETSNEQERIDNKSKNEYSPSNNTLAKADIYGYFHNQSRYDILNANIPVNFNDKFQELNELDLTGRYLH